MRVSAFGNVNATKCGVLHDKCTSANKCFIKHLHTIAQGSIDANKNVIAHRTIARYDDVRRYKAMVADCAVMPDMVTRPKNGVVANSCERLNSIVLKQEHVVTNAG